MISDELDNVELEQLKNNNQSTEECMDRRTKLLYAARDVFLEKGYVKANLDQIIEIVGGSRRNIYNEFGNKQGLFLATVDYFADKVFTLEDEDSLIQGNNLKEALENFGTKSILSLFQEENLNFIHLLLTESITWPELYTKFNNVIMYRKVKLPLIKILQHARKTGELTCKLDDDFIADFIIASVRGQVDPRILYYYKDSPVKTEYVKDVLTKSLDLVLVGLC